MVKIKKWNLTKWKKETWKEFSRYVRQRDRGICFTCSKVLPDYYDRHGNLLPGWKSGQAGHWITAANCGPELYFHEQNVHCQCHYCNINLSGNWLEYEKKMILTYGKEISEKLKQIKWTSKIKYKIPDYEIMHEKYKQLNKKEW